MTEIGEFEETPHPFEALRGEVVLPVPSDYEAPLDDPRLTAPIVKVSGSLASRLEDIGYSFPRVRNVKDDLTLEGARRRYEETFEEPLPSWFDQMAPNIVARLVSEAVRHKEPLPLRWRAGVFLPEVRHYYLGDLTWAHKGGILPFGEGEETFFNGGTFRKGEYNIAGRFFYGYEASRDSEEFDEEDWDRDWDWD